MKRKKGLTLVEIIVAMAILTIVSVGFLGVMTNNMNFIMINRGITEQAFSAQQAMELKIDETRNKIYANDTSVPLVVLNDVFENGITVNYHQMDFTHGNSKFHILVTNAKMPTHEVPVITNVTAQLRSNSTNVTHAYATSDINVLGAYTLDAATQSHFMVNVYHWYKSRDGFNIPVPSGAVLEIEMGTKYPKFPDDYEMIPGATNLTLNNVETLGGKHLVLAVTPASKTGKLGKTVSSNPVYISGLPVTGSNLVLHLEGSFIDKNNTSHVTENSGEYLVKEWIDLSTHNKPAIQSTSSAQPKLMDPLIGGDFVGRYAQFLAGQSMTVSHNALTSQPLHAFAVVRGDDGQNIFVNGTQTLVVSGSEIGNGWKVVYGSYTGNSNLLTIGNSNIEIAELLLYRGALTSGTPDAEFDKTIQYLTDKYKPIDIIGDIDFLYNDTDQVHVGETYTPPYLVKAKMVSGPDKYVPVSWNGTVNTSVPSVTTLTGTAISDTSKTMTLTVTVLPPIAVTGVTLNQSTHTMMALETIQLVETVSPENAHNKTVNWSSSNTAVATVSNAGLVSAISAGTATITASTVDGNHTASCIVTVLALPTWPSGMVLQLDASLVTPESNNRIATWLDQSGGGNHFTQSSTNSRPDIKLNGLNALPVINFSSRNSVLVGPNNLSGLNFLASSSNQYTIFIVNSATSDRSGIIGQFSNASPVFAFWKNASGNFENIVNNNYLLSTLGNNAVNRHTMSWDGGKFEYWLNGTYRGAQNLTSANTTSFQNIQIGLVTGNSSNYLSGDVAEIIVFNRKLNDQERLIVETALKDKWFDAYAFEFNSGVQGWSSVNHLTTLAHNSAGFISATITGNDPHLQSLDNLNQNINTRKTIKIRMRNQSSSTMAEIYFTTNASQNMAEDKVKRFPIVPNSDFIEYTIDMSDVATWTGTLRRLRIDPTTGVTSGSFGIDYIRILP